MIRASRREALAGALAVPAVTGLPNWWRRIGLAGVLVLHDASLDAGRLLARMGRSQGNEVLALSGDPIRFGRAVFDRRPKLVLGISRQADAVLIEDVAREAGYVPVAWDGDVLRGLVAAGRPVDRGAALGWIFARPV